MDRHCHKRFTQSHRYKWSQRIHSADLDRFKRKLEWAIPNFTKLGRVYNFIYEFDWSFGRTYPNAIDGQEVYFGAWIWWVVYTLVLDWAIVPLKLEYDNVHCCMCLHIHLSNNNRRVHLVLHSRDFFRQIDGCLRVCLVCGSYNYSWNF